MATTVELLRERSGRKDDFDTGLREWDKIPSHSEIVWTMLDSVPFRKQLLDTLQRALEEPEPPTKLPQAVEIVLEQKDIHPMTILDTINKAGNSLVAKSDEQIRQLLGLIAQNWITQNHMTKILVSFVRDPDCARKMTNMRSFYGVLFTTGEKFIEDKEFIPFLLEEIIVTMRVLAARDHNEALSDTYPWGIATFIERTFVRYYALRHQFELDPFTTFMHNLIDLCEKTFRIQRLVSNILLQISIAAQDKILTLWFREAKTARIPSSMPFYPVSTFMASSSYQKTLLFAIPFSAFPNEQISFWTNWADYITSDPQLTAMIWDKFMDTFWKLAASTAHGERLITPAFAFAALAKAMKPRISEIPLERIMRGGEPMNSMNRIMMSVDLSTLHLAWAIIHMLFDLCRLHQDQAIGTTTPIEPFIDSRNAASDIYLKVVGLYEGKPPNEVQGHGAEFYQAPEGDSQLVPTSAIKTEEDDGQEKFDECLDDRVRRLRAAGLTPTSMLDVYHIFTGDTTGSNEAESEALKKVAILTIPMLVSAGLMGDPRHMKFILTTLLQWGDDEDDDGMQDIVAVCLTELGTLYPDLVASCLEELIFGKNHSVGDKAAILKLIQKAVIQCGTNRCISCCSEYSAEKKKAMENMILRFEPRYFPKYLYLVRDKPLCITCPRLSTGQLDDSENIQPTIAEDGTVEVKRETPSPPGMQTINGVLAPVPKPQPLRPIPVTRRWGTVTMPKVVESYNPSKKILHTYVWRVIHRHLSIGAESYVNANDDMETHFLLQLLEFSKILFMSYTGLNTYMENCSKEVLKLLVAYKEHQSREVRKALWTAMECTVTNPSLVTSTSLLQPAGLPDDLRQLIVAASSSPGQFEGFLSHLQAVLSVYDYQSSAHNNGNP